MKKIHQLNQFLTTDIWRIRARKLPRSQSLWINQLRIILLAVKGFNEDKCQLRASALTYYSLLSIVPVTAMAFGIAKGFGMESLLEKQFVEKLPEQQEIVTQIISFSHALLSNTQGGVIAGVGVALLFWTIIKVLGNIEESFNEIWGVKKGRSLSRKFSDYLSIMLICLILFIMSSSVTVLIVSQIKFIAEKLLFLGPVSSWILLLLKLLPYAMMGVLLTFIYIFMPNTKVNFKSGLMGGVIAGTVYQITQLIYINFQIGVTSFGAIYGSFAALPLFLAWLQLSWLIVLFGAEISFAEQNVETYEFEPDSLKASHSFQRLAALGIAHLCVKRFDKAQAPLTGIQIAHTLEIPVRLARQVLFELTESGILSEVKIDDGKLIAYQPARDINDLTIQSVSALLDHRGIADIPFDKTVSIERIKKALENFSITLKKSPDNLALKDIE